MPWPPGFVVFGKRDMLHMASELKFKPLLHVSARSGFAYQIEQPSVGRPRVGRPIVRRFAPRLAQWKACRAFGTRAISIDLLRLIDSTFFYPNKSGRYLIGHFRFYGSSVEVVSTSFTFGSSRSPDPSPSGSNGDRCSSPSTGCGRDVGS